MRPHLDSENTQCALPVTGAAPLPRIGAHISTAGGLAPVVGRALAIEAEAVQIFNSNARTWRTQERAPQEIATFAAELRVHDLPLVLHAIYLINLASDDMVLRERSLDALADAMVLGALTGAVGVVTHLGARHNRPPVEAGMSVASAVEAVMQRAGERIAQHPEDPRLPVLLLENSAGSGTSVGCHLEELAFIADQATVPCGICLDTAHLFAAGYPIHAPEGLAALVAELKRLHLLPRLRLIHLNDSKTALGSRSDRHENLGEGQLTPAGLAGFVRHPAFRQVPFVLEVPGHDKRGPDRINVLRAKAMRRL